MTIELFWAKQPIDTVDKQADDLAVNELLKAGNYSSEVMDLDMRDLFPGEDSRTRHILYVLPDGKGKYYRVRKPNTAGEERIVKEIDLDKNGMMYPVFRRDKESGKRQLRGVIKYTHGTDGLRKSRKHFKR